MRSGDPHSNLEETGEALFAPVAWAPSAPTDWQMIGQIGGRTRAVAVQGSHAYVGVGLRLLVLDVSNPAVLVEVGNTQPFPYFVEDIAINGTCAYLATGYGGLRVVDISKPDRRQLH